MNNTARILVVWLTVFIDLVGFGIIIPILPDLAVQLGGSEESIAVAALYPLMNFFFAPIWGNLSDRFGRRPIILISIVITALSQFWFAFISAFWMLAIQRSLAGIGSANISAANAYMADISTPQTRARNMGLIGAAFGLGFIFGPIIGGYVYSLHGLYGVGMVSGGISLFNAVLGIIFLKESLKEKKSEKMSSMNPVKPLLKAMQNRSIRGVFILNLMFIMAFSLMQVTAAILWEQEYHLDKLAIGKVFAFIGICTAIVQFFLVGILNRWLGEKRLLFIGLSLMALSLASLPLAPNMTWELIALAGIALANGCVNPSILSLLSGMAGPREQGNILGLNQSMGSLGRVIGPTLGGVLYAFNFHAPYFGGALILIMAVLFTFDIFRKQILPE